jgi:hypothetical protein
VAKWLVAILAIILIGVAVFIIKPIPLEKLLETVKPTETRTSTDEAYNLLEQELNSAVSEITTEDVESAMLK